MSLKKKAVSLLLAMCMMLTYVPAFAVDKKTASDENPFSDVSSSDWFYEPVGYVYKNGLMVGTEKNKFSPSLTTTRGMIVTILHAMEGKPSVSGSSFSDVAETQYYANAIKWANKNNIVSGYGNGKFGPDDSITREQMTMILYRYAQYKNYDTEIKGNVSAFSDGNQVSSYAVTAMNWAVGAGLIAGMGNNTLAPNGSSTRAQVATILTKFCTDIVSAPSETEKFTVTFDYNYDSKGVYQTVSVEKGKTIARPADPTRSEYTFDGWYTKAENGEEFDFTADVTKDITLYARWSKVSVESEQFTVTFDYNYNNTGTYQTVTVEKGKTVTRPADPVRTHYIFTGWYTETSGQNVYEFDTPINQNITLYAQWRLNSSSGDSSKPTPTPTPTPTTYTITFETNGGSAVNSQTVRNGECAREPIYPTRAGYTFVGWYSNSDLTVIYDFNSPVTANITLYARWNAIESEEHTFLDDKDPDVEIYSFKADKYDILIGSPVSVTFTAEIFSNIELNDVVKVIDKNGNIIGTMTEVDGIYTLTVDLSSDTVKTVTYYATVKDVKSQSFTIGYYKEYNAGDQAQCDQVIDDINKAIAGDINGQGYLEDGKYDDAISKLTQYLDEKKTAGIVSEYTIVEKQILIKLSNGMQFIYELLIDDGNDSGSGQANISTYQPFKNTYSSGTLNNLSDEATDGSGRRIDSTFSNYDFNSITNDNSMNTSSDDNYDSGEVTLDNLKKLADYPIIIWHGHGGYEPTYGSHMSIGQSVSASTNAQYNADISSGRILASYSAANRHTYTITGGFIDKYVGDMTGTMIYLATCSSGRDMLDNSDNTYSLAQSFINKGATAVIANSGTIKTKYNVEMERDTFKYLCQTGTDGNYNTLSSSLALAKADNGEIDANGTTPIIFPQNNHNASDYRLHKTSEGIASGSVKDASTSQNVSNALIRVYTIDGDLVTSVRTDANGYYNVQLPSGDYIIKVSASHYKSAKMAVTVTADETVYTETFLLLDAELSIGHANGRITNAVISDQGVSDVTIRMRLGWNNYHGTVLHTTTTNENGYYEISYIAGVYTIEYSKPGFVTGYRNIVVGPIDLMSQNAVISPLTSEGVYRIVLRWSNEPSDLDAHLTGPLSDGNRFHMYYPYADENEGSLYPDYVRLDLDNTTIQTRPDPETTTIVKQLDGPYVFSVHDFTNAGDANSTAMARSDATVTVTKGSSIMGTFHVPSNMVGTIWRVFELNGDTITPLNYITNGYDDEVSRFDPYK